MGQGLNTKVAQAAAHYLGCDLEMISVGEGNSHILPNSGVTGGSNTSENCVYAVKNACDEIKKMLEPGRAEGRSWVDVVQTKGLIGQSGLMATGWSTGKWDKRSASERLHAQAPYNVYGACVSEVLVDMLTGEVRVERVDILMDLGHQLNAAVDVGQVEGGFIMALGYLLTEELKLNKADAKQLHLGSWEYKVPTAYDIPIEMNVSLLDSKNPNGVQSSKASAEPAMHLISSPYMAVKNAIYAARKQRGLPDTWFPLDLPLSPENIQQAIAVSASEMILP